MLERIIGGGMIVGGLVLAYYGFQVAAQFETDLEFFFLLGIISGPGLGLIWRGWTIIRAGKKRDF